MTCLYQFTEAIISISPEIPALDENTPAYHRSISILGNTFHAFDYAMKQKNRMECLTTRVAAAGLMFSVAAAALREIAHQTVIRASTGAKVGK